MINSINKLGSKENPVHCSGESGIRLYLDSLLDWNGMPIQYVKMDDSNQNALCKIISLDGKIMEIYFDKSYRGFHETVLIDGFKTHKDFIDYKKYTKVKYFNDLLKSKDINVEHNSYLKLWKLCGILLSFGPGFYSASDEHGMPIPTFKMEELKKACLLVVHSLAGINNERALPFFSKRYFNEFINTFHLQIEELITYKTSLVLQAKCKYKYDDIYLELWIDLNESIDEKSI